MTDKQVPSYPLRMPPELREELTVVAKQNNRSVNAEIVARLEHSLGINSGVGVRPQDPAVQVATAASLADVAVMALTQDESWRSDVARRVANILGAGPEPAVAQQRKPRPRSRKD